MKKNVFLTFALVSASLLSSHLFGADEPAKDVVEVVAEPKEATLTTVTEQLAVMSAKLDALEDLTKKLKLAEEQLTEKTKSETQLTKELREAKEQLANEKTTILNSLRKIAINLITEYTEKQFEFESNKIKKLYANVTGDTTNIVKLATENIQNNIDKYRDQQINKVNTEENAENLFNLAVTHHKELHDLYLKNIEDEKNAAIAELEGNLKTKTDQSAKQIAQLETQLTTEKTAHKTRVDELTSQITKAITAQNAAAIKTTILTKNESAIYDHFQEIVTKCGPTGTDFQINISTLADIYINNAQKLIANQKQEKAQLQSKKWAALRYACASLPAIGLILQLVYKNAFAVFGKNATLAYYSCHALEGALFIAALYRIVLNKYRLSKTNNTLTLLEHLVDNNAPLMKMHTQENDACQATLNEWAAKFVNNKQLLLKKA